MNKSWLKVCYKESLLEWEHKKAQVSTYRSEALRSLPRISEPTPKRELFTYCSRGIEISQVSERDSKRIASNYFNEESQL